MNRISRFCLLALVFAFANSVTIADDSFVISPLVMEGDSIPGVGDVTRIDNLVINDASEWFVEVDTNFADTDQDVVLLKNDAMFLREGFGGLDLPPLAIIDSFDSISLNNNSVGGFNFFIDPFQLMQIRESTSILVWLSRSRTSPPHRNFPWVHCLSGFSMSRSTITTT